MRFDCATPLAATILVTNQLRVFPALHKPLPVSVPLLLVHDLLRTCSTQGGGGGRLSCSRALWKLPWHVGM